MQFADTARAWMIRADASGRQNSMFSCQHNIHVGVAGTCEVSAEEASGKSRTCYDVVCARMNED